MPSSASSDRPDRFSKLVALVSRLRAPDGCPWDRKQTPASFKKYLLEETHELLEAIDSDDSDHIREELGDLLFQVVFLANLYQEEGRFGLDEVLDGIIAKMIRRHPHVFADQQPASERDLRQQWQRIKMEEKQNNADRRPGDLLAAIPKSLPALQRAYRVSERAARSGFSWPDQRLAMAKVEEELAELKTALASGSEAEAAAELGDLLFALAGLGCLHSLAGEELLHRTIEKFIHRFEALDASLRADGKELSEQDPDTLLKGWQEIKERPGERGKKI